MQKHEITPTVQDPTPSSSITYILLIIILIQGIFNTYLLTGNSVTLPASTGIDAFGVKKALLELEYEKVGGKENYELVTQATLIQMKDQIPQIRQFVQTNGGSVGSTDVVPSPQGTTMTPEKIQAVLSGAAIEGNTDADIIVIEYSDMECPFCVRQYSETKLRTSLLTQYGEKVAFAFKNNRGVNHSGTEAKAVGALCAKKLGGSIAYAKFYHAVMDATTQSAMFPVSQLPEVAKTIGLDTDKWNSCYTNKDTLSEFVAETEEAQSLGLGGTPGTLILNVKSGEYKTVEGAYPITNFIQHIDSLMK